MGKVARSRGVQSQNRCLVGNFELTPHTVIWQGLDQSGEPFSVHIDSVQLCSPGTHHNPPSLSVQLTDSWVIVSKDGVLCDHRPILTPPN
jgi:hypothetical protein